ncbi:heterotrimeric G-protein alpha subunit, GPA3-like protein, partial [Cyathus striatus]
GTSESGKSTIVKRIKIACDGGFSHEELMQYRSIVYQNVIDSAQQVIAEIKKLGLEYEETSSEHVNENPSDSSTSSVNQDLKFNREIAEAIEVLWKDPVIARVMNEHSEEFYLMDSANYFFAEVMRIGEPKYVPNEADVLRAQHKMYGVIESKFMIGPLSVQMFNVSYPQSEVNKWKYCFENVTSIIFCASLSGYDQIIAGENKLNRLDDSLNLFKDITNSPWFHQTSVILLLTKLDIFSLKITKEPLEHHFPEYTGGCDVNKAKKYILMKFMMLKRARLSIYPHLTEATDDPHIVNLLSSALKETILQNALKHHQITQVL